MLPILATIMLVVTAIGLNSCSLDIAIAVQGILLSKHLDVTGQISRDNRLTRTYWTT